MHNPILDTKTESHNFNGFYRGVVIENLDPKEAGRIQVQVYPMFTDVGDLTTLPWAIPADPKVKYCAVLSTGGADAAVGLS